MNPEGTGFTAKYVDRLSGFAKARRDKAWEFMAEVTAQDRNFDWVFRMVWGSADALILYSQTDYPGIPADVREGVANHVAVAAHIADFWRFYEEQPWQNSPAWAIKQEDRRLRSLLPENATKHLKQDFVRRVFAGFALDGFLLRKGCFGRNPVILGVESSGVAVLQNAALEPKEQIPVIQLK
ncbi:MAG: hypothetical protein A3B95_01560 [Candidatus Doudnabacteria bacterium RIFCSPHIGHO2_02_FULL_43_13b]|nr:MAG: hypothetical protein A3B95_01560 [Candidatus Doudnabacteria bacterium RIFCSPHIGHO2_02_FULL_43_13b]